MDAETYGHKIPHFLSTYYVQVINITSTTSHGSKRHWM